MVEGSWLELFGKIGIVNPNLVNTSQPASIKQFMKLLFYLDYSREYVSMMMVKIYMASKSYRFPAIRIGNRTDFGVDFG